MDIAKIVISLIAALSELAAEAVEAYVAGDPSKLKKVQDILPPGKRLKSEQTLELERERARRALQG